LVKPLRLIPWNQFFDDHPPFLGRYCPDCPVEFEPPSNECISCGPLGAIKGQLSQLETNVVMPLPDELGGGVGVLRSDGQVQMVTAKLGARLQQTLASDAVLVSGVEPATSIGGGARLPAAVALSADGSAIVDRVWQRAGGFISSYDREVIGGDEPLGTLMSAPATVSEGPAPRRDYQAVYSRAAGKIFLVGGLDSATNQLAGDIWWSDVAGNDWLRIPLNGYAPEQVLAAAYSYRDKRLWVLDQSGSGADLTARLVSVEPTTGAHAVLGTWKRTTIGNNKLVFDHHWLALDRDGSVLLAASSAKLNKHVIVRIDNGTASAQIDGLRVAPFNLVAPPAVDTAGYSLVFDSNKGWPELKRMDTLEAKPGRWIDVGGFL